MSDVEDNKELNEYLPLCDKYIPKTFSECVHSPNTSNILTKLSKTDIIEGIPNIVLYGPAGCGKYTRLLITLNNFFKGGNPYNSSVKAINVEDGSFVPLPKSRSSIKYKVIYALVSKIHCEIELEQANAEKVLIPFLDYYSRTKNICLNTKKYIILRNIELLNKETQNALRRIIELSQSKVSFLVTIRSISKLIDPLKSRFLCIAVKPPTRPDVIKIIKNVSQKENFSISSSKMNEIIEKASVGTCGTINLHEMFLILEGSSIISDNKKIVKIYTPDKCSASDELLKVVKEGNRYEIRNTIYKIYEILKDDFENIITGDFYNKMIKELKERDKIKFVMITANWNAEMNKNYIIQPILQAEAYLYEVCELYGV